jgi:hypothetical protein
MTVEDRHLSEKWYFDVLTDAGLYLFGYLGYSHLLGFHETKAYIFCSSDDSAPCFRKSITPQRRTDDIRFTELGMESRYGGMRYSRDRILLEFDHPEMRISLEYSDLRLPDPARSTLRLPAVPAARRRPAHSVIAWTPVLLKGRASGVLRCDAVRRAVSGWGYIDRLTVNRLPLRPVLNELFWGRVHAESCDLTFAHAVIPGSAGAQSRIVMRWLDESFVLDDARLLVIPRARGQGAGKKHPRRTSSHTVSGKAAGCLWSLKTSGSPWPLISLRTCTCRTGLSMPSSVIFPAARKV